MTTGIVTMKTLSTIPAIAPGQQSVEHVSHDSPISAVQIPSPHTATITRKNIKLWSLSTFQSTVIKYPGRTSYVLCPMLANLDYTETYNDQCHQFIGNLC